MTITAEHPLGSVFEIAAATAKDRVGIAHRVEGGLKLPDQVSADEAAQYLASFGGHAGVAGPSALHALLH